MNKKKLLPLFLLCNAFLLTFAMAGTQGDHPAGKHQKHREMMKHPAPAEVNTADVKLLDLELVNQDGERLKFQSDAIGKKQVVMDFIFTTCTTICPIQSAIFAKLQDLLGERLGKEVALLSVSVDPMTDIPARLKEYARRYQAKPGWTFLTGQKQDVDRVLRSLEVYSADFTDHPPVVLVGDGRKGIWKRLYGFPSPEKLMAELEGLEERDHGNDHPGSLRRDE